MVVSASATMPAQRQESPRSIGRLLRILDCLGQNQGGASLAELAHTLDMPKSSLLVMLRGLAETGHVAAHDKRYRLGSSAYDLGLRLLSARPGAEVMRQAMRSLWEQSQETTVITTIDRAQQIVTYQDAMESVLNIRYTVQLGRTRPLYCTAAGLVSLAFQDRDYQDHYLRTARLEQLTETTVTDRGRLRERLDRIREEGVAISMGEAIKHSVGVAAPIIGLGGKVEQALMVAGPSDRVEPALPDLKAMLLEITRRVSGVLQFAP